MVNELGHHWFRWWSDNTQITAWCLFLNIQMTCTIYIVLMVNEKVQYICTEVTPIFLSPVHHNWTQLISCISILSPIICNYILINLLGNFIQSPVSRLFTADHALATADPFLWLLWKLLFTWKPAGALEVPIDCYIIIGVYSIPVFSLYGSWALH